jgi:glycosyltransferase involved in cell wall biosynthesis
MSKTQPKLSIVVPIYNVEAYLEQCLASIQAQTLQDIEVLCINDGSTDGSLAVIQRFAAADERFVVVDKPNGGYGQAMNRGLELAQGEYLGIVESDDWVEPDMFESLYLAASFNQAPLARGDYYLSWTTPQLREEYFATLPGPERPLVANPLECYALIQVRPAIWSSIYRRSFLADFSINFTESPGASYQDTAFSLKAFSAAERVALMHRAFYHYRQDNLNASTKSVQKVYAVVDELENYRAWLEHLPERRQLSAEQMQRLRGVLEGIIYKTCRWNLLRIEGSLQPEFLQFMQAYFAEQLDSGRLQAEYFEHDFYAEMQLLVRDPERYLSLLSPADSLGAKLAKLGSYRQVHGLGGTLRRVFGGAGANG